MTSPSLDRERELLDQCDLIISLDEVGRGALAGPVAVGAALCDSALGQRPMPEGLRDSKLIPEKQRAAMAGRAAEWVCISAVGWAGAGEVDEVGILGALGRAAVRAITAVRAQRDFASESALVLLDGHYDYVSTMFASLETEPVRVLPVVKGDRDCASISAASVIAKVARDEHMQALHERFPVYSWDRNKGYASAAHRQAIREHGLAPAHRASWSLRDVPETLF